MTAWARWPHNPLSHTAKITLVWTAVGSKAQKEQNSLAQKALLCQEHREHAQIRLSHVSHHSWSRCLLQELGGSWSYTGPFETSDEKNGISNCFQEESSHSAQKSGISWLHSVMKDEPNLPTHFCTHNYSIRIGLYGPKSFKKQAAISYSSPSPECTDFLGLWICFSEGPLQRL